MNTVYRLRENYFLNYSAIIYLLKILNVHHNICVCEREKKRENLKIIQPCKTEPGEEKIKTNIKQINFYGASRFQINDRRKKIKRVNEEKRKIYMTT